MGLNISGLQVWCLFGIPWNEQIGNATGVKCIKTQQKSYWNRIILRLIIIIINIFIYLNILQSFFFHKICAFMLTWVYGIHPNYCCTFVCPLALNPVKHKSKLRFGQREISTKPIVFANYKHMTSIVRGIRRIYQLLILLLGGKIDITYRYSPSANKVIWYGWVMI